MEAAVGISCCTTDATFENLFTFFVIEFQDQNTPAVVELGQRLSVIVLSFLSGLKKWYGSLPIHFHKLSAGNLIFGNQCARNTHRIYSPRFLAK